MTSMSPILSPVHHRGADISGISAVGSASASSIKAAMFGLKSIHGGWKLELRVP